jgi:hypothetical protein
LGDDFLFVVILKFIEKAPVLGYFFHGKCYVLIFTNNGLGLKLGDFNTHLVTLEMNSFHRQSTEFCSAQLASSAADVIKTILADYKHQFGQP